MFDADFCPRPDFLRHLVPYLEDPQSRAGSPRASGRAPPATAPSTPTRSS
ncbi:hypothetical protein ACWENQ_37870 [Nonomuraea sp. NPDC004354]